MRQCKPQAATNDHPRGQPFSKSYGVRKVFPKRKEFTVNTYFFVSTILKVPTEFSFNIGMAFTNKYQPIPTKKI